MIEIQSDGSFDKTEKFLRRMSTFNALAILEQSGQRGVEALRSATPRRSGLTAESWTYTTERRRGSYSITWHNTNVVDGVPIAILLQYGHGTGTGGYVTGIDYINPAIKPIFDKIATDVWRAVTAS